MSPAAETSYFTYTENDNLGTNIALGYPPPAPVASMTPVAGFRDYASLFAQHQALLTLNDEVDGEVVGETLAGRDIWAYVIGDPDSTTAEGFPEAAVLINGGIHAREWQTPEAVTSLFETLVAAKADGGFFQYLVDNLNTIVVPVNNVDGFIQTQLFPETVTADRGQPREGRMRRKNLRNPVTNGFIDSDIATVADNFWGVDLNRNASQGYGQANRSSTSPTSLVYRGAAPESEPELLALLQAATLGPASRLRLFSDTHSFGQDYFAPQPGNTRLNAITQALAMRMIAASGRAVRLRPRSRRLARHRDDRRSLRLRAADPELDARSRAGERRAGLRRPRDPRPQRLHPAGGRGRAHAQRRRSPVPARLLPPERPARRDRRRDPRDRTATRSCTGQSGTAAAPATRALTVETNEALLPGVNYRLWVAFNKPMRIRNSSGAVVSYAGQSPGAAVGTVTLEIPSLAGQDHFGRRHGHLAQHGGRRSERVSALFRRRICSRLHRAGQRRRRRRRRLPCCP